MSGPVQFCSFYLDRQLFGIEVLSIQEVLPAGDLTEVPLAPGVVRGLMNLRGSIVSSIDLRRRFGMGPRQPGAEPVNIVVQTEGRLVSLEVDRVGEVVELNPGDFDPPPPTLAGELRQVVERIYKLEEGLLLALHVGRVLEIGEVC